MKANVVNAFWFYSVEPEWHTEIDVYEVVYKEMQDSIYRMTIHIFKYPGYKGTDVDHIKSGERWTSPYKFADDFHVYALEWDEQQIKWYVDGHLRRTAKNEHNSRPMNLCIDAETFPTWFGLPTKESLPATYEVDYVRSWKRTDMPTTAPATP